jgi:superfamily I DNA/RNA helicase
MKSLWSDRGEGEPLTEILTDNDREEAKFVSEEVFRLAKEKNMPWRDFAVLYRSNAQSRIFEEEMRMLRVPYHIVGGYSFLDRKEVKNTLCYWRLVMNPKDDASLRRVVNWPARGIGKSSLEALGTQAFEKELSLFETMSGGNSITAKAAGAAQRFTEQILSLRTQLEAITAMNATDALPAIIGWARGSLELMQIKKGVEEDCDEPEQAAKRWENVEELLHALGQMPVDSLLNETAETPDSTDSQPGVVLLREFLSRMTLDPKDEDDDGPDNEVTLMTLHGAKGLEFPIVFLVGVEDGILPHQRSIDAHQGVESLDEERRLCYVGITRAKDFLYLTRAKVRIRFGKEVPRIRSRFCDEIPSELLLKKDETTNPVFDDAARDAH